MVALGLLRLKWLKASKRSALADRRAGLGL
jgi:hypothetical protein